MFEIKKILVGWRELGRKKKEKQAKQGVQTNLSFFKRGSLEANAIPVLGTTGARMPGVHWAPQTPE